MTPEDARAALDAHDALVTACIDGGLTFAEFLGAYLGFPGSFGLRAPITTESNQAAQQIFRRRIAFHVRVAEILSGLAAIDDAADSADATLARFAPRVGLMRLRALGRENPNFEANAKRET